MSRSLYEVIVAHRLYIDDGEMELWRPGVAAHSAAP